MRLCYQFYDYQFYQFGPNNSVIGLVSLGWGLIGRVLAPRRLVALSSSSRPAVGVSINFKKSNSSTKSSNFVYCYLVDGFVGELTF